MSEDFYENNHSARSNFVRSLIQEYNYVTLPTSGSITTPRQIIQYWHNFQELPKDVEYCMNSWHTLSNSQFEIKLYDEKNAKNFIAEKLGDRYVKAFENCYHPAMQSDYFRLCYIYIEGGLYVDADDVFQNIEIDYLFIDERLKISPLCYDCNSNSMVPESTFINPCTNSHSLIFYFNNNPLIAGPYNYLIQQALYSATIALENINSDILPEIQATTGPGNLTKTIFKFLSKQRHLEKDLVIIRDWDSIAVSKWPLNYRNDERNWRLSNQQRFF